jgi:two-component system chemotaxis response regulator CheY
MKPSVLIVDDEPSIRSAVSFHLEEAGFAVSEAGSGTEALARFDASPVDLILSDIRMPKGDGLTLLKAVRSRHASRPAFLFMSGFSDVSLEEAYYRGADGLIVKPFEFEDVVGLVEQSLQDPESRWCEDAELIDVAAQYDLKVAEFTGTSGTGAVEIGRGGLFFELDDNFPRASEQIRCVVTSREDPTQSLEVLGIVRWVRHLATAEHRAGVGLEFLSVEGASRKLLFETLKCQERVAFIPMGRAKPEA